MAVATEPAAVIALVHGYGDHGGRHTWFGEDMAARGYAVYVYDLRGHGQSSGTRGQIKRFDDYLDDTAVFLDEVRRRQPGKPVVLLGHSLGGLICARFAQERPCDVRALVLSSPFFALTVQPEPMKLLGAKALSTLWPGRDIGNTVRAEDLSHDTSVVEAYVTDPLVHHVATARWAAETLAAQDAAMAAAPRVTLPLLVLYGKDDEVADPSFAEAFFATAGSADKKLIHYEGFYHELFNEVGREQVFADVAAWLAERLPDRAGGRRLGLTGLDQRSARAAGWTRVARPPGGAHVDDRLHVGVDAEDVRRLLVEEGGDLAGAEAERRRRQGDVLGDVAGVEQHVAEEALAVLPARALQHRRPDEDRLRLGRDALVQRRAGDGQAQVARVQALERAAEHVVVVQALLEPLDVVGDHVVLDGVEAAGRRRGAEGEALLPRRDAGARPQQRPELAEGERLGAVRAHAPAAGERVEQPAVVERQVGQLDPRGVRIRLEPVRLVRPVHAPADQVRAAVPRVAQIRPAAVVVHGRRHPSRPRVRYGVGMNSTDGRRWLRRGYSVISS